MTRRPPPASPKSDSQPKIEQGSFAFRIWGHPSGMLREGAANAAVGAVVDAGQVRLLHTVDPQRQPNFQRFLSHKKLVSTMIRPRQKIISLQYNS